MIEFALGAACGAVAVVSVPAVNTYAVRLRDWVFDLFRKGPDESDEAGA